MRNKHAGVCYYCGKVVHRGEGHPERNNGKWRVIHAQCAIEQRNKKVSE